MVRSIAPAFLCILLLAACALGDSTVGVEGVGRSEVRVDGNDAKAAPKAGEQKFEFQAEVNRLMDIIINSLYSNKDIFLRELISNASDALDKIRYLSITDPKQLESQSELEVRVRPNKEANTLEIIDSGIGMTKQDLIKNLGTIAKSGTKSFLDKAAKTKADSSNLIGQFGVGFYSAYLVADKVTVTSKHNDDKQYVWESGAEQTFTIYEDTEGEQLERGTKITLHMKEDALEYLDQNKVEDLIKKYSQFINFPIFLQKSEQVEIKEPESEKEEEKPEDAEKKTDDETAEEKKDEEEKKEEDDDEIKVEDADTDADKEPKEEEKKEPKYETKYSWELVNENKPIWTRDPKEVTEAEYTNFYEGISKMPGKPMARAHFRGEGDVEFKSLIYIPDIPPTGLFGHEEVEKNAIKLFVRRVLVSDKFEMSLLPRYLGFLVGIVDSDDLPINVSREMLQQSKTLDVIRRKLVRKALEMIKSLMKQDEGDDEEDEDAEKEKDEDKEAEKEKDEDKEAEKEKEDAPKKNRYLKFWSKYGKSIKLGVIEDRSNKQRLAKLLRFRTSQTNSSDAFDWASLDQYMERMKKDQDNIYYLSGESLEVIEKSPFLEKLLNKGYEVLYLSDPIDEHMMMNLPDYEGSKFMSIAKDNFKFGDKDEKEEKDKANSLKKLYKPLTKYLKSALGDKVSKVKLSTRLSKTPCVLSTEQFGYSARMEIIMKAQAFSDPDSYSYMTPKSKIMELNPHHPIVKTMLDLIEKDAKDTNDRVKELGHMVYDTALVSAGYLMRDNSQFAERMYKFIGESVGVDAEADIVEDYSKAEKIEEEKKEDAKTEGETETKGEEDVEVDEASKDEL